MVRLTPASTFAIVMPEGARAATEGRSSPAVIAQDIGEARVVGVGVERIPLGSFSKCRAWEESR